MYEKCIKCDRLGKDCIPNLYVMSVVEIRDWARKLKEAKGWTNAHLAEVSGVPKGTIDSNFSKRHGKCADVNYSTFAPVLCALLECEGSEMPCRNNNDDVAHLLEENAELRKEIEEINQRYDAMKADYNNRISYFKDHIRWKQKIIITLIIISCVLCAFILIGLAIDWQNNGLGFFWLNR